MATIDLTGNASEVRVNTTALTGSASAVPDIATLTGGGWVVAWANGSNVRGQRYAADGSTNGAEFGITNAAAKTEAKVAPLSGGGFVLTWSENGTDVYGQRYDASGIEAGSTFRVNTGRSANESGGDVAVLTGGDIVVVFQRTATGADLLLQRYAGDGTPIGGETPIATGLTNSPPPNPAVAALGDGGYVVAWQGADTDSGGIFVQRFDASGSAVAAAAAANTVTAATQTAPAVAALAGGGFVLTWRGDQEGNDPNIYARQYDATGTPTGPEFRVNTTLQGSQDSPVVAGLAGGGFVVSWWTTQNAPALAPGVNPDIYERQYGADGKPLADEAIVHAPSNAQQFRPAVAALPSGDHVVAWNDITAPGVFAKVITSVGATVSGTAGDDTFLVTGARLVGTTGIDGGAGNDVLQTADASLDLSHITLTGIETITTTNAIGTRLLGSPGDDHYVGAGRYDTFVDSGVRRDYTGSGNLAAETVSGPLGSDTLKTVEEIDFRDGRVIYDVESPVAMAWRYYVIGLERHPDSVGFNNWITDILTRGPSATARSLADSTEFAALYGSLDNTAFVTKMYQDGLGRAPDSPGLNGWVNFLNTGGTRAQVMQGFANSAEAVEKTRPTVEAGLWDLGDAAAIVARVYDGAFGRLPTRSEFNTAMDQLDTGAGYLAFAAKVATTSEFTTRYGALDNGAYVDALYQTALGRAADPGGRAYWINALDGGTARSDVMFNITNSAEHQVRYEPTIQDGVHFQGEGTGSVTLVGLPFGAG